jgi:alanyl-tRNA synthetase
VLRDVHPDLLLPLATELAKKERTVALLALEASGQLVFAQHPSAGKDLAALLKQVFVTFAGKGGGTRDFVRAKLSESGSSSSAVALARKLLLG